MSLFGHALFNYNPPLARQEGLVIFWVNGDYIGTLELNGVNTSHKVIKKMKVPLQVYLQVYLKIPLNPIQF